MRRLANPSFFASIIMASYYGIIVGPMLCRRSDITAERGNRYLALMCFLTTGFYIDPIFGVNVKTGLCWHDHPNL